MELSFVTGHCYISSVASITQIRARCLGEIDEEIVAV
jgi:hypothetical protein